MEVFDILIYQSTHFGQYIHDITGRPIWTSNSSL